jgi:hypothetical protein
LQLSPETKAKLLVQAVLHGKRPEELALKAIEDKLADVVPVAEAQSPQ